MKIVNRSSIRQIDDEFYEMNDEDGKFKLPSANMNVRCGRYDDENTRLTIK